MHGIFNGSDECAAKSAGHALRGSICYIKTQSFGGMKRNSDKSRPQSRASTVGGRPGSRGAATGGPTSLPYIVPFSVCVDYFGYRIMATACCSLDTVHFNENGDIKNTKQERLYGTFDRGKTVLNENKLLDFHLQKAAKKLNLSTHGVKGTQDLTTRYISGSCTMKGFKVFYFIFLPFH